MPEIQIFDIVVLVLVGGLTLRGVMRGMIAQIASVAAIVVSWGVAVKFSPLLAPMISDKAPANKLIAMLILFVATSLIIWLLSGMLDKMISAIKLKKVDRVLGGTIGLIKGVLLCALITFFLVVFSEKTRTFALNSVSGKILAQGIDKVAAIVPDDLSVIVRKNLEGFRDSLKNSDFEGFTPSDFVPNSDYWTDNQNENESSSLQSLVSSSVKETIKDTVSQTVNKVKSEVVLSLKDFFGSEDETPLPPPSPLQNKVKKAPTESPVLSQPSNLYSQDTYSQNNSLPNAYPSGSNAQQNYDSFPNAPTRELSQPIYPFRSGR